ncbi:MAG: molybdenum cofactor biosynthesis protein MoaE [Bacteroidota bacterium]
MDPLLIQSGRDTVEIQAGALDPAQAIAAVTSPNCGAIDVFIGTVRNQTKEKPVLRLEFEAYEEMALKEMKKIIEKTRKQWPVQHMAMVHRTGILGIGEIAVIIAVSTPHRAASFAACQYAIDTLKETVPIWKKEIFEDGEVWVAAHP